MAEVDHLRKGTNKFVDRSQRSASGSTAMPASAHGRSRSTPRHGGEEVWVHGDSLPGNLLVVDGRLSAVIDFGCLNVGDPACDLLPAWNVFAGESRARFRAELEVDEESWSRGRGWALCQAVSALPYYWDTNPGMIGQASHALAQVFAEDSA